GRAGSRACGRGVCGGRCARGRLRAVVVLIWRSRLRLGACRMIEPKGRAAVWTDERGREERAPERGGKTAGQSAPEASRKHSMIEPKGRTGRRPGTPDTREAILAVARRRFAAPGYDATPPRGVAP